MVVDLNDRDAVVAYVRLQASRGLHHVTHLVRDERDAMIALLDQITDDEARMRISDDEYSVSEVLQHLNLSFERSQIRLWTLSQGQPFVNTGSLTPVAPGGLPEVVERDYAEVRRQFEEGEQGVITILEQADTNNPSEITASHAQYGPFNWLEWAVYSHFVHTSDHTKQVARIVDVLKSRR
jgi:hypothetical protein